MRLVIPHGDHVLGRSAEVDFRLNEAFISEHHARLRWLDDTLTVTDLGSTNGTKVNGASVAGNAGLNDGDVVRFGSLEATVHLPGPSAADPTAVLDLTDPSPPPPPPPGVLAQRPPPTVPTPAPAPSLRPPPATAPSTVVDGRRVFVSYSSQDSSLADEIYRHLGRVGWDVWRDEAKLGGGENWSSAITEGLRATSAVVVLITENSMTSKWVRREIRAADRAGIPILPIRVGGAPIPDELALLLNEIHHIDISAPGSDNNDSQYLQRVESDLLALTRREGGRRRDLGRTRIRIGKVLTAIGLIGVVAAFAMFFFFLYVTISNTSELGISRPVADRDQEFLRAFAAFPVFFVSAIIAAIGQGLQRSGERMQI